MDYYYLVMPFIAWLVAGCTKFVVNSLKVRRFAFDQIGYGGMPSTHSAIVSGVATLIALKEGVGHPAFGVALCLAFIVMLDANSLRRQIGQQAAAINRLSKGSSAALLRERIGHSRAEIFGGVVVGLVSAWLVNSLT